MERLVAPFRWFAGTRLARNFRFRLILIVLLASLPALVLLFLTANQQRDDALETGQEEAVRLARTAASDQGRQMDRVQRELTLLARLPEVRGDDSDACSTFFQRLVSDPEQAIYVDLRVIGQDSDVFCRSTASNPLGPIEDQGFIEDAFAGVPFTVGPYRVNNGNTIISFASPVRDEESGEIIRVAVATLDLESQSTFVTQSSLPEGAVIEVVAADGTLLLQRPPQEDSQVGASLSGTPELETALGMLATPVPEDDESVVSDEGYVIAVEPIPITSTTSIEAHASVVVKLPEEEIVRRADDSFRGNLGRLAVAAGVVVFAAWVSADLFVARDAETRKSIVAELYHAYSSGAVEHLEGIVAPDFVDHSPGPDQSPGIDGLKQSVAAFRTAFPDGDVVPREMLADRDKVVARVSLTGTHLASFQGVEPSGKRMIADGVDTFQFREGVITESWSLFGPLVEMEQLTSVEHRPQQRRRKRGFFQRLLWWRRDEDAAAGNDEEAP